MHREETVRENQMIRELINDKRQLEENIQYMKSTIHRFAGSDSASVTRSQLSQSHSQCFQELFDCVDATQVQSLSQMNQK
jgi:hypothetical protein